VAGFGPQAVSQNRIENNAADLAAGLVHLWSITNTVETPGLVMGDRNDGTDNLHLIAQHTCGMVFFGTPFRGSAAASWASTITTMVRALWDTNEGNLADLQRGSDALRTLRYAFPGVLRKRDLSKRPTDRVNTVFFVEQLKTKGVMVCS
jgi:protein SERAC1